MINLPYSDINKLSAHFRMSRVTIKSFNTHSFILHFPIDDIIKICKHFKCSLFKLIKIFSCNKYINNNKIRINKKFNILNFIEFNKFSGYNLLFLAKLFFSYPSIIYV